MQKERPLLHLTITTIRGVDLDIVIGQITAQATADWELTSGQRL